VIDPRVRCPAYSPRTQRPGHTPKRLRCGRPAGHLGDHVAYWPHTANIVATWPEADAHYPVRRARKS